MELSEFDYQLPEELIALEPEAIREFARLMTISRDSGAIGDSIVSELPDLLLPGDLMIFNDTKVIPARIFGKKESGGKVEIFLVRRVPGKEEHWEALVRSSKGVSAGARILLPEGAVASVVSTGGSDTKIISFSTGNDFDAWLEKNGTIPLPPYIRRRPRETDRERYQTVFANARGAVAAPTAGLHFTNELMEKIRMRGVDIAMVTLHVGPGTFMPVRVDNVSEHKMHRERVQIPDETIVALGRCKANGGRVVAVGTTVVRALEYSAREGSPVAGSGETDIFIYPGYRFRVVDALITNFHLPKSTLLMLVSAFASRDLTLEAYRAAVQRKYRFYSYGDAMFIY